MDVSKGRRLWESLHFYYLDQWEAEVAEDWFKVTWFPQISDPVCNCKNSFSLILHSLPPVFDSYYGFVWWTWRVHNAVNSKLGKPSFSWEAFVGNLCAYFHDINSNKHTQEDFYGFKRRAEQDKRRRKLQRRVRHLE